METIVNTFCTSCPGAPTRIHMDTSCIQKVSGRLTKINAAVWRQMILIDVICLNVMQNTCQLDGCIVWNARNKVFGSKRSAICAQGWAVYFLHSTMPSVMCLRLSDASVICHVTYFYFLI